MAAGTLVQTAAMAPAVAASLPEGATEKPQQPPEEKEDEEKESRLEKVQQCRKLLEKVLLEVRSGLISSIFAEAILFPLDTVKLRQQVHGGRAVDVFREVLQTHGVMGFFQGLIGRLIQTVTSNVGFFIWQTVFVQIARSCSAAGDQATLGTGVSLIVNMLAQQLNRLLTTPIDVVANINQADPESKGFFHTFSRVARRGGRPALWRGLSVALVLSLNPALMFTLVEKLSALVSALRGNKDVLTLAASDMFWVSGMSKAAATLLTYPLIRAKAVMQSVQVGSGRGLWGTLVGIASQDGMGALYSGVWIMSWKTVLFNSLMMSLKQKITLFEEKVRGRVPSEEALLKAHQPTLTPATASKSKWRKQVKLVHDDATPWEASAQGDEVIYVDGSWCHLHEAQLYILEQAARLADHVIVGIHNDQCHHDAVGAWPSECFSARLTRLQKHPSVGAVLEGAPWAVDEDLITELGITKVIAGSVTKTMDCAPPNQLGKQATEPIDPYHLAKQQGIFEEVRSLNHGTEHEAWVRQASRVLFSNVDASIDWRILVKEGASSTWGRNPGYSSNPNGKEPRRKSRSKSVEPRL